MDPGRRDEREHSGLQGGVRAAGAAEPHLPRGTADDAGEHVTLQEDARQHLRHQELQHPEHDDRTVRELSTADGNPLGE